MRQHNSGGPTLPATTAYQVGRRATAVLVGILGAALALSLLGAAGAFGASGTIPPGTKAWRASARAHLTLGVSVRRHRIGAQRQGLATAPFVVLIIGQMHGDESRGPAVVAALRQLLMPSQVQIWTISTINPDGATLHTRRNADKVDLNRNFPFHWSNKYSSQLYYPGPRPASEPETRELMAFLQQSRPDLVISLHQHGNAVDASNSKTLALAVKLGRALGLKLSRVSCRGVCSGTLTGWYNATYPGLAITVELPSSVPTAKALRYARGILSVVRSYAPAAAKPVPIPK